MDHKDVLHIIATLSQKIGAGCLLDELDNIGWRGIESHPVEYFQGYISEWKDNDDREDRLGLIVTDIENIAANYGFELAGDEFVDIVPR